jgi:hypothetical protein
MAENFLQKLFNEVARFLAPILAGAETEEARRALLLRVGWRPDNIGQFPFVTFANGLNDVSSAYTDDLLPLITTPPQALGDVPDALKKTDAVISALVELGSLLNVPNGPTGLDVIGEDLLGLAAADYLDQRHPVLTPLFALLTLIRQRQFDAVLTTDGARLQRDPVRVNQFAPKRTVDLLRDPVGTLKQEYHLQNGLTQPDLTADTLFPRIARLGQALGLPTFYGFDPADGIDLGTFGNERAPHMLMVFVPIGGDLVSKATPGFGVGLALDQTEGLVVFPFGTFNFTETVGRWGFHLSTRGDLPAFGVTSQGARFDPNSGASSAHFELRTFLLPAPHAAGARNPVFQIGSTNGGTRLELSGFRFVFTGDFTATSRDFGVLAEVDDAAVVISGGDGDGFLAKSLPGENRIPFKLGLGWSSARGVYFKSAAGLEVTLPVSVSIGGVVTLTAVHLQIALSDHLEVAASMSAAVEIGPVTVTADHVGVKSVITFPDAGGNLGPLDGTLAFKPPEGLGISVNAGSVTGGGFLFFDSANNRYGGALELKVYSVAVKAFGVLETKLPGGQSGYSFAIVISAEFTPIQLGLGFTLNGVGGIIGINRRIDQDALAKGVRTGALERLLFPHDVVHDAPQIIHDLQAILPPTDGRYVFGPLAKIGWGTPTIIEAELGIILELPGPRLALLGEVSALLPKKDKGVITLNLSVAGLLDFPKKYFAIDASLHDSKIGSYPVSGDMAMRMTWGDNPTFALAVGGFNPAFQPPAGFPVLRRVAVDLGVSGNPSLTLQGYFALTSNTAQFGALAEMKASGSGVTLYARVQFDALIVFSPFSFEVDISAQVSVKFHGHGITAHLRGMLSGPSPWHVRGEVCVSILWWDACLSFDKTFGSAPPVELPSLDPWLGTNPSGSTEVLGLQQALQEARNWTPEPPPAAFTVVSFADNTKGDQLFDPLGVAVVKQSVCPFNLKLQRFGSAKASGTPTFVLQKAAFDGATVTGSTFKKEPFAKAQFVEMTAAQKLSAPAFEPFDGAIRLPANDNRTRSGSMAGTDLSYQTKVLGAPAFDEHPLPPDHLANMVLRSAAGLRGLRRSAAQAYLDPTAKPRFTFDAEEFVIGDKTTLTTQAALLAGPANKAQAIDALNAHLLTNPEDRDVLQVYPKFELGGR